MAEFGEKRYGPFYRNDDMVEHGCCWGAAICCKTDNGEGQYGRDELLVLECDSGNAEYILEKLNRADTE